jgi:hypothetical protein
MRHSVHRYTIIAGHPVPYSLTVQYRGRTVRRLSAAARLEVEVYLDTHLSAGWSITRVEGGYVFYAVGGDHSLSP